MKLFKVASNKFSNLLSKTFEEYFDFITEQIAMKNTFISEFQK